ncbi:MAG: DNA helicase, partial [Bacteroidetes bacterium]
LSHIVQYYLNDTSENILLLAYTNRAVDEMCLALDKIGGNIRVKYMRIGSRISSGSDFTDQLLSVRLEGVKSRRGLIELLKNQRIIISTLASITGAQDVFSLMSLSTVIVDEASQILEPLLAGILPLFKKVILIGDHKQLPAVVVQSSDKTRVEETELHEVHLYNTRTSYFERMYSLAVARNWHWAFGCLYEQGRMHDDIMQFVSEHFYEKSLKVLPKTRSGRDLLESLRAPDMVSESALSTAFKTKRMIFIPGEVETDAPWLKTNDSEARIVVEIVRELHKMYPDVSIGVITPFRAQIANIRAHLINAGINPEDYSVDTVERYQGSARDIIVLSVCVNDSNQLKQVVSLSGEGVDRKLNVAITRAREQFIWTGAPSVLSENALYSKLMSASEMVDVCCIPESETNNKSSKHAE